MSSEYSERVDLFLFQIRSLGVLYSLTMRIVASRLKEGEFRVKDIGESVPKRIFLSLFFQNLIFTKRLILLYSLPEHRKKLTFIVPLSRRCHPTISSSVILFSSCSQSFPASFPNSILMSQLFTSGSQSIGETCNR